MTVRRHPLNRAIDSERIAKVIARAGLCSRREAERWIADGRVSVNGKMLDSPAFTVGPDDRIIVDGRPLPASEAPRLFLYHKPAGLVTTVRDEKKRPTVFAHLPPGLPRVVSVGRLDINSEGLLLLTNDGGLARYLELPANALKRCYRMRLHGPVKGARLARLTQGITVDGVRYGPMEARIEGPHSGANLWLVVTLKEGKNREIRKVMAHLGLQVTRLIRTAYGPFQLGHLPPGSAVEVPPQTMKEKLAGYFTRGSRLQSVNQSWRPIGTEKPSCALMSGFEEAWKLVAGPRDGEQVSPRLQPLVSGVYLQSLAQPLDQAALKSSLEKLLEFLAADGRTNANCWAVDLFFMFSERWERDWAGQGLPEDFHEVLARMGEALHDTVKDPDIARKSGCLPEQLLERVKRMPEV